MHPNKSRFHGRGFLADHGRRTEGVSVHLFVMCAGKLHGMFKSIDGVKA